MPQGLAADCDRSDALFRAGLVTFVFDFVPAVGKGEGGTAGAIAVESLAIGTAAAVRGSAVGLAALTLLTLIQLLLGLGGAHQPVIVLGVLQVVFGHDAIAGRIRISRKLQIFLVNMGRGTANLDLRTARIECAVGVVVLRPAAASTRAFHEIPFKCRLLCRPGTQAQWFLALSVSSCQTACPSVVFPIAAARRPFTILDRLVRCAASAPAGRPAGLYGPCPGGVSPHAGAKLAARPKVSNCFFRGRQGAFPAVLATIQRGIPERSGTTWRISRPAR